MITFKGIIERANTLKLPIAEIEFKADKKNPPPEPPYLIYFSSITGRGADAKNNISEVNGSIELYTDCEPDKATEKLIEETILFDVEYKKYQAPTDEGMIQTAYEFNLTEKRRN